MRSTMLWILIGCGLCAFGWNTQKVRVKADDLLRFSVTEIQVKEGESVEIVLENVGKLKAHAHNFALLKQGTDLGQFSARISPTQAEALLPQVAIAYTAMAAPGEEKSVTFNAPPAGRYTYICTYPGHNNRSKGTLVVSP